MKSEIGEVLNKSTIKYFVEFDNGEEQVEKHDPLIYIDPDTVSGEVN